MDSAAAATIMNPDTYVRGVPYVALAELQQASPVAWLDEPAVDAWPAGPGFWAVLRHADVRHMLRHPEVFSSQLGATQSQTRRLPRRWASPDG